MHLDGLWKCMATLWGELGSKAWLWPPPPHADFPMYVSVTGGVGSMVWLGLALHPRTGDRMHLDGI